MKNKILSCLCLAMSLMFSVGCNSLDGPFVGFPADEYSSRVFLELTIADSTGNNALENIAFQLKEGEDTALSIKAQLYQDYTPIPIELGLLNLNATQSPDKMERKKLVFNFPDSTAYKSSNIAPFPRTYRLGLRIPKLFSDKEYHFFKLSYSYDKRKAKLLSATFEEQEVKFENIPLIEDYRNTRMGHSHLKLTYRPKR